MKRRALERHLRQHGARVIDEGANHTKWRDPDGGRSVMPRHGEIGPGVALAICKQLGIPRPPNPHSRGSPGMIVGEAARTDVRVGG